MTIIPYTGLDDLRFNDNLNTIRSKVSTHNNVTGGKRVEMDKTYPTVFISDINTFIVFSEDGNKVRYFEVENDVIHSGKNLYRESIEALITHYEKYDNDLLVDDDGFDSPKFGFMATREKNMNIVLVYSREYAKEESISEDDIINFYL